MTCNHRNEQGESSWKPSKNGKYEICENCDERFPCSDLGCAHFDCRDTRGQKQKCYYCSEVLTGVRGESWGLQNKRGGAVTAHYCCRDSSGSTSKADLIARAKGQYFPEDCPHSFDSKENIDPEFLKKMACNS